MEAMAEERYVGVSEMGKRRRGREEVEREGKGGDERATPFRLARE